MNTIIELEKQILALPAAEREQLAAMAWDSLIGDPSVAGNRNIDPEGIKIAAQRDAKIEAGAVQPLVTSSSGAPVAPRNESIPPDVFGHYSTRADQGS